MKRYLRILLGTIGCVVVLAAAGCGGTTTTGPAHPTTVIHPSVGPFTGQIDPAYSYMAISAGYEHACGLDTSGHAYCWGDNTNGDLGDGTMTQSSRPVTVLGGHVFSAISAGFDQTCAVGAQADSGKVFCWGNNAQGQLGVVPPNTIGTPPAYETQPTPIGNTTDAYTSVSAGYQATCALDVQHLISCWGNDYYYALGVGSGKPFVLYGPTPLDNIPDDVMPNPGTYASVAVSDMPPVPALQYLPHACALGLNQQIYCWGYNGSGELSIPIQPIGINNIVPNPTRPNLAGSGIAGPLPRGTIFMAVGAGGKFTCGIVVPGMQNIGNGVYCWGDDSRGQFGGASPGGPIPVGIQGTATFQSISIGYDSACGTDGNATEPNTYCWGNNSHGQLGTGGIGTPNNVPTTTAVAGHHFTMVSVGVDYACGIVTDYSYSISAARGYAQLPYCWGANSMGQLGDGNMNDSSTPVLVLKHP